MVGGRDFVPGEGGVQLVRVQKGRAAVRFQNDIQKQVDEPCVVVFGQVIFEGYVNVVLDGLPGLVEHDRHPEMSVLRRDLQPAVAGLCDGVAGTGENDGKRGENLVHI